MQRGSRLKTILIATLALIVGLSALAAYMGVGALKSRASSNVSVNQYSYGKSDNNDHSGESIYTISEKTQTSSATVKYHADTMSNGTILHAWCWSFDTIKENIADIKAAGYTSIQTSPISWCVTGNGGNMSMSNWYYHYQPTGYGIGNYQLGSEAEFKEMCATAEKYGIKIIVDCVFNHMTSDWGQIASEYQNSSYYHTNESVGDWDSRWEVTQKALLGLWDLNTQNTAVQQFALNYTKLCVADGADGFRYDAAKHIELPDDSGCGGNFWPTVLNNGAEFQYGEILQDSISRDAAYASYMGVTASGYGYTIRNAVSNNNLNSGTLSSYGISAAENRTVTWVESHDNFANDSCETVWMTNEQIKLAWAVLAARRGSTPLFYNRPVGAGGTSYDSRFPGQSQLGDAGDSFYKDDEIAAVNIFRNMMEGESEYLRNIDGNQVLMVERGTIGAVIINSGYSGKTINSTTNLASGDYYNHTDDGSLFTVSNGKISGTVPARSIAVLYQGGTASAPSVGIKGYTTSKTGTFTTDYVDLELTTGNSTKATYSIDGGSNYVYESGKTIRIGWGCDYGTTITVTLKAENDDATTTATYAFKKMDPNAGLNITFTKPSSWSNTIYAYIYSESGSSVKQYATWPGTAMATSDNSTYTIALEDLTYDGGYIIFTDGNNQAPAAQQPGFTIENYGQYTENGLQAVVTLAPATVKPTQTPTIEPTETPIETDEPTETPIETNAPTQTPSKDTMVIYYYTNWSNPYMHYKVGSDDWTSVPGVAMTTSDVSGYYKIEVDMGNQTTLKACFNNGSGSWDNNNGNNYTFSSVGTYTVKDNAIQQGAPGNLTIEDNTVTIYYYTTWNSAYAHYQIGSGSWTNVPGTVMNSGSGNYKTITIDLGTEKSLTVCFNNSKGNWDNNGGNNYKINAAGTYTIKNGKVTSGVAY